MGIERISKSQVSEMAKELDASVKAFRERPLDLRFKYVWLDTLFFKCRGGGRIASVAGLVAVGVTTAGAKCSGSTS